MENQISALFTRCPKCRSFSIQNQNYLENNKTSLKNKFFCSNCNHKFSSKVEKSIREEKIPEKPIQEETIVENEIFENKDPVEKTHNSKRYLTFAVFSIILTITLFAFVLNQKKTKNLKGDNLKKGINAEQVVKIDDKKQSNTTVGADHLVRPNIGQKKQLITKKQKDLSESKIPDTEDIEIKKNNIDKDKTQKIEKMPKLTNRTSIKAIKLNYLRVRTSHALESDPSFRWKFKTKTITIRREKNQKVYIAGNSSGTKKWMVDDAIYINDKKFQGWEIEPDNIGVIPHENRKKPLDITNMVPPEKDVDLKIDLIDYGKFWGNTSIYIVVK